MEIPAISIDIDHKTCTLKYEMKTPNDETSALRQAYEELEAECEALFVKDLQQTQTIKHLCKMGDKQNTLIDNWAAQYWEEKNHNVALLLENDALLLEIEELKNGNE